MAEFSFEQIEAYLKGNLKESERAIFETKMEQDDDFREKVMNHQLILEGLKGIEMENFKGEIASWEADIQEKERHDKSDKTKQEAKVRKFQWWRVAAAAIILGLIFLGTYYVASEHYSRDQLIVSNYQEPVQPNIRGNSILKNRLAGGVEALTNKDYTSAIDSFQLIPSNTAEYTEAQFYLGHSQWQQDLPTNAINTFRNVISIGDSRYRPEAEWMIVLCHMKTGNKDLTLQALQNIINQPGHSYQDKAKHLQKHIRAFWYSLVN